MSPSTLERPAPQGAAAERAPWRRRALEALCSVDSTTGDEDRLLPSLEHWLTGLGAHIRRQTVDGPRANILALWPDPWGRPPRLLLTTHLDTVPPFTPPRPIVGGLAGRGTCDAKGQIVAQLAAIRRLLAAGERRFAWLGVVGEETDGAGAAAAVEWDALPSVEAVILGEPTGQQVACGQKGYLHLRLRCRGDRAHGSDPVAADPRHGRNAIWKLHDWLHAVREQPLLGDPEFGLEQWNLGRVAGGETPNVVADQASADLVVRTIPGSSFARRCAELAPASGTMTVISEDPPMRFAELPGWPRERCREAVGYGSDAPRLSQLVTPADGGPPAIVLLGPGSITTAHTDSEHLMWHELDAGVDTLVELCRHLLAMPRGGRS